MAVEKSPNIPPFVRFCAASVPMVFDNSLSYYECLCALTKFLQEDVVNVINNNANLLEALDGQFKELKSYVDNYFASLDVQEEINNKLDEMAEGGQLAGIIAQFLAAAPVFGYGTIAEMAAATNLSNGCIARVLGNSSAAAGDGAYYMIRTRIESDDPDGVNLVAIGDSLVGVRVQDASINALSVRVDDLEIQANKKYLFIGDSYGTGQNELQEQTTPWTTLVPQYMGLTLGTDYWTDSRNGSGFNNGYTFKAQLEYLAGVVPDTDAITDIVIVGGYNDQNYDIDVIDGKMAECFSYAKTTYPNATIKLACVGWSKVYDVRQFIATRTIPAYQRCGKYNVQYLTNTEFILHDYSLFSGDNYHPNQAGQNELSAYLVTAIKNGSCSVDRWYYNAAVKINEADTLNPAYAIEIQHNDRIDVILSLGYMVKNSATNLGSGTIVDICYLDEHGLVMGSGIDCFTEYTEVYVATAEGTNLAEVRGWVSVGYDIVTKKPIFRFITDKRQTTNSNIAAYNFSAIHLTLPALYC